MPNPTSASQSEIKRKLRVASSEGNLTTIQELIRDDVDLNQSLAGVTDILTYGYRAIHWAACRGQIEVIKLLVNSGKANINITNYAGNTALHDAICYLRNDPSKRNAAVRWLVYLGADVNAVGKYKYTPLHYLIYYSSDNRSDDESLILFLIQNGADLTNKVCGKTPWELASYYQYDINAIVLADSLIKEIFQLFKEKDYENVINKRDSLDSLIAKKSADFHKLIGISLSRFGRLNEALDCFKVAGEIEPENLSFICHQALTYYYLNNNDSTIELIESAINNNKYHNGKKVATLHNAIGLLYLREHNHKDAINCFDEASRIDNKSIEPLINKATALFDTGKYDDAYTCYLAAIQISDDKEILLYAYNRLSFMLECQGKIDEASKYKKLTASIITVPRLSNIPMLFSIVGDMDFDKGDFSAAIISYEKFIKLFPGSAHLDFVFYKCGLAYFYCKIYDKAADCFNKALGFSHENCSIRFLYWKGLADTQYKLKEYETASESYKNSKIDTLSPEKKLYFFNNMGILAQKNENNNNNESEKYFKMAFNLAPLDEVALSELISIYYKTRKFAKIIKYYEKFSEQIVKFDNKIIVMVAEAYYALEIFLKSIEVYQKILDKKQPLDSENYYFLAESFFKIHNLDQALIYYNLSLSENPAYTAAKIGKASTLCKQDKYTESQQLCDEILQSEPNNALALACTGHIKFLQKNYPLALSFLHRAHSLDPRNETILLWLIDGLKRSGYNEKALEYLEKLNKFRSSNIATAPVTEAAPLPSVHEIIEFNKNNKECEKILLEALAKGADINAKDAQGNTILHKVILFKRNDLIQFLHDQHILLNELNNNGDSALHCAVSVGSHDAIQTLLGFVPLLDIDICNSETGETALHKAIREAPTLCNLFIGVGADINRQNKKTGDTPLFYVILYKRKELYANFVALNANPSLANFDGLNCLSQTFIMNEAELFKQLVSQKVKLAEETDVKITKGFLHLAIERSNADKTQDFLGFFKGYRPNLAEFCKFLLNVKNAEGMTPLEFAIQKNKLMFFKYFISILKDKDDSLNQRNSAGKTLLILAIESGLYEFVKALLDKGADPKKTSEDGVAPISFALRKPQSNIIELLLSQDCAAELVLYKNDRQQTLLHLAILWGVDVQILDKLYQSMNKTERKNWLNHRDNDGQTALHLAVQEKNSTIFDWLLAQEGIDINQFNGKEKGKQTPLHIAVDINQEEMVNKLCHKKDLKFYLTDNQDRSPLFFAEGKSKSIKRTLKGVHIKHFHQQLSIHFRSKFKGKQHECWLNRLDVIMQEKDARTHKLKKCILGLPKVKVDKIAESMANLMADSLNNHLAVEINALKYQELFANQSYHAIDNFLLNRLYDAFLSIDAGKGKELSTSKSTPYSSSDDGFIMPRSELNKLKKEAFIRTIIEGLQYQFYICKALQEKVVDRKADMFDKFGEIIKDIEPMLINTIGSNSFNGSLATTCLNCFLSVIKSIKDSNARERAEHVLRNYGNGFGSFDDTKIKGVAEQLFIRFESLIYQQSVGLDSCGKLHKTPLDGVVCFALAITQRINKHIIENKSLTELEDGSAIVNLTKSAGHGLKKFFENNFVSPQNQSVIEENLYLSDRCIFASWYESGGEDIEIQLDSVRHGENERIKAGNLLRYTGICIMGTKDNYWKHSSTRPEWGYICASKAEAEMREYSPCDPNEFKLESSTSKVMTLRK